MLLGFLLSSLLIFAFVGRYKIQTYSQGLFIVHVDRWTGNLAVKVISNELRESTLQKKWIELGESK